LTLIRLVYPPTNALDCAKQFASDVLPSPKLHEMHGNAFH
jgi:hypothetical protein